MSTENVEAASWTTSVRSHADLPASARSPDPRAIEAGDGGAVLVEFAVVFPLLVFLVFGIFGAGIVLNQRLSVTQAGREGARYGSTVPIDQCVPVAECSGRNWAKLVQEVTSERSAGAVTTANVCVALGAGPRQRPNRYWLGVHLGRGHVALLHRPASDSGKRVQVKVSLPTQIEAAVMTIPITLHPSPDAVRRMSAPDRRRRRAPPATFHTG